MPQIHRWLARHPRFHAHFTATSWLYLEERWIAALTEKQISRGVHRSTREPEEAIRDLDAASHGLEPCVWTKTGDEILTNVARFGKRISDVGYRQ